MLQTIILDCERLRRPVTFYTHERTFFDAFTCIDKEKAPFTLESFCLHGGLVYYKENAFAWRTFSIDDIDKIIY